MIGQGEIIEIFNLRQYTAHPGAFVRSYFLKIYEFQNCIFVCLLGRLGRKLNESHNTKALFVMGNRYYHGRYIFRGYRDGRDLIQNYEKAYKWYEKAAEQGEPYAHGGLATMYEKGLGVTQNYETALKYFYLSRFLGNKITNFPKELKFIESKMTGVEIDSAKRLVVGWMEAHKQLLLLKDRCRKIRATVNEISKNNLNYPYFSHREFAINIGCWWQ